MRTAGGRRVVDSIDWLPRRRALGEDELRLVADGSIYAALAERGLPIHHGVAHVTPDTADAEIAAALCTSPRGALLLTLFQVDEHGRRAAGASSRASTTWPTRSRSRSTGAGRARSEEER